MENHVFTIRDLEQARNRDRRLNRDRSGTELRDTAIAFAVVLAVLLVRGILL